MAKATLKRPTPYAVAMAGGWVDDVVARLRERAAEYRRKGCITAAVDLEVEAQLMASLPR